MNQNMKNMLDGKAYRPDSPELSRLSSEAHRLSQEYNGIPDTDSKSRNAILDELFPGHGKDLYLQGPIQVDYGCFTEFGDNVYANFNLTILDTCPIKIGNNVMIGPNTTLATPLHPLLASQRNPRLQDDGKIADYEYGAPITIEDNCWLASNVTVCPGVTIGHDSVIGAGCVVTKNIPPNSLVLGVPGKVVKTLSEADRIKDWPY